MASTVLQSLNFFLIVFPFVLSLSIVIVRIWRKLVEKTLAIGEYSVSVCTARTWTTLMGMIYPEDALLMVAEALIAVLTATMWKYVVVSFSGFHQEDIPEGAVNQVNVLYWRFINNAIYNPILGLVKISFLITLQKLRSPNRMITASLWTLIIINVTYIFAATFGSIFMCIPVRKSWIMTETGSCGNRAQYIFGVIGVTIATDVLVTIIPAWIVIDLRMSVKNKLGVIAFLSLPLAVTTIACYRLHTFLVVFSLPKLSAEDPYNIRNALSNIESNLAVIATCGPTIKWILGRFIPWLDSLY
ncbi:hypothetical protein P153DRAFT_382626 [Dothidotthia symphoricarpi CBS 119687]|uniref:Rhodopsin domain-containing protein n=1 Tax=Dothidotthia symphoricarpi CBS 119687 TaxID=1392245 RepID=A0A6A6AR61_9PLEO|nr:uncharacterized protein P153DRAFT_382626 [Dothidotthia symphoricarpi CBS 119687]KAF2133001.1 hypothetical protein P153DRAFT_382626 [Dothidotthia symphoricarpi CBS 119687]